jgi:hypothetical protein
MQSFVDSCAQTGLVLTSLWVLRRGRRDGWPITAGHDRCQCKHVRYPAIAERDDLRMGLGVSVEQRKLAGLSRTIDRYR